jgi:hypothetical protein
MLLNLTQDIILEEHVNDVNINTSKYINSTIIPKFFKKPYSKALKAYISYFSDNSIVCLTAYDFPDKNNWSYQDKKGNIISVKNWINKHLDNYRSIFINVPNPSGFKLKNLSSEFTKQIIYPINDVSVFDNAATDLEFLYNLDNNLIPVSDKVLFSNLEKEILLEKNKSI